MEPNLNVDVSHLTDTERQVIYKVLKRDEDLRKRDEQRINRLKSDLQLLRRRGALRGGLDPLNSCSRCRCELGKIINRGSLCAICRTKICKSCRVYAREGTQWICIVCHKQLELEAATGEWMNEFVRRASRKRDKRGFIPPSDVVKDLIVRSQSETGGHGSQEKEGLKMASSQAVSTRPKSALSMERHHLSPAVRRKASPCEITENAANPLPLPDSISDASVPSPKRSSEVPIPAPRQKSPLLKQRAVVHNSDSTDHSLDHQGTVVRRQAPRLPHHSDRSDSGIGQENQPSPKTSHSDSIHSRQSSSNSSGRNDGRGTWSVHTESQTTTADSGSDLSDSEVEPSTGVVFRKVTLKRRKRKEEAKEQNNDDANDHRRQVSEEWEDHSLPPPWGVVGASYSLPRFSRHSRSSPPVPNFVWDTSCDLLAGQLTRTNSSDSLWWDATKTLVLGGYNGSSSGGGGGSGGGGSLRIAQDSLANGWFALGGLGVAPGLSRSLGTVHVSDNDSGLCAQEYGSSWSAETLSRNRCEVEDLPLSSSSSSWRRSSTRSRGTPAAGIVKRRRCHSGSWDDLRVSSPEYEEDYPINFQGVCVSASVPGVNADSFSDILCNVTDKIVPEGDVYRIVFISSSSSSKSSGLDLADGSSSGDCSASSSRRVSMLMEDSEWGGPNIVVDSPPPPPLPSVPPPIFFDHPSRVSYEDEEFYDFFRDFVDAEWKEETVVVADESECEDDDQRGDSTLLQSGICSPSTEQSTPFAFVRTSSLRSSGERSIGEQSFSNQVFAVQSPTSPQSLPDCQSRELLPLDVSHCPGFKGISAMDGTKDHLVSSVSVTMQENADEDACLDFYEMDGAGNEPEGSLPEVVDSSDDECLFGSYDVNPVSASDSDDESSEADAAIEASMEGDECNLGNAGEGLIVEFMDLKSGVDELMASLDFKEDCPSFLEVCSTATSPDVVETGQKQSQEATSVCSNDGDDCRLETTEMVVTVDVSDSRDKAESREQDDVELVDSMDCNDISSKEIAFDSKRMEEEVTVDEGLPVLLVCQEIENDSEIVNEDLGTESKEADDHSCSLPECPVLEVEVESDVSVPVDEVESLDQSSESANVNESDMLPENAIVMSEAEDSDRLLVVDLAVEDPDVESSVPELDLGSEAPVIEVMGDAMAEDGPLDPLPVDALCEDGLPLYVLSEFDVADADGLPVSGDEDAQGETSSDGEKLESDTDSLDTVIEGETFRRMRQVAIHQKLVQVNRDWEASPDLASAEMRIESPPLVPEPVPGWQEDGESSSVTAERELLEDDQEPAVANTASGQCDRDATLTGSDDDIVSPDKNLEEKRPVAYGPATNLHELIAQSRALSASFKKEETLTGPGGDAAQEEALHPGVSILEKYFMNSLEQLAPTAFNRNRTRQHEQFQGDVSSAKMTTVGGDGADGSKDEQVQIDVFSCDPNEGESGDSWSETQSEDPSENYDSDLQLVSTDGDSETAFDDDDTSSMDSTSSSEEGTVYLRTTPARRCSVDEPWYRLDMSLHTIVEESCEESESERQNDERKRVSDPSELERYFRFTFEGGPPAESASASSAAAGPVLASEPDAEKRSKDPSGSSLPLEVLSMEDEEYSDDTFSESSVFSESSNRDEAVDDEELARLASSRLEKYFLTGLLGMEVVYPEVGDEEDAEHENATTPTCEEQKEDLFQESARTPPKNSFVGTVAESLSSKEETEDEDAPFEKNDGCDTIKRKKKGQVDVDDPEFVDSIKSMMEMTLGRDQNEDEGGVEEVPKIGEGDESEVSREVVVADEEAKGDAPSVAEVRLVECLVLTLESTGVEGADDDRNAKDEVVISIVNVPDAAELEVSVDDVTDAADEVENPKCDDLEKEELNALNLSCGKDARSLPLTIMDIACEGTDGDDDATQLSSWDSSAFNDGEATNPVLGSRGLTLDWKQQSRDSGFIGSSDDLLQDGTERLVEDKDEGDCENRKSDAREATADDAGKVSGPNEVAVATVTTATHSPFGLFRSSSTRSNFYAASTTSDDEAQYIVNQLVAQIAKSMSRSPQLARAKPPEIEVFESELTKLMQTVPGIDATVKEIVEELSSTDYCSDSYESSDYASSDQEGSFPFEIPKLGQTFLGLQQLQRSDSGRSWRSLASTASKSSSVGGQREGDVPEDGQKLPEETVYIYQRFMDSLTKMTEHASEEAKMGEGGEPIAAFSGTSAAAKGSPPTAVKMLHHIRSKLTSLMREVQVDRSPKLGGGSSSLRNSDRSEAGVPRRTIVWNKPGSGSGSAAGDELSISSTSSTNFDSEDSPTDTELSMDSDEVAAATPAAASSKSVVAANARALAEAQAHIRMLTKSGDPLPSAVDERSRDEDEESADGLERWSSDMTIVDDDVRFISVHKSEPILSLPNAGDEKRHSRELSSSSKTLPSTRLSLSSHPDPGRQGSGGGHQRNSVGSLCYSTDDQRGSSKSEWDVWRADRAKASSAGFSSSLITISVSGGGSGSHRTPYKHKSCDPLPSVRCKGEPRASATTPRDRKKHALAFLMRQKSGSSTSLREGNGCQETRSIKQQIQFRSSIHLQSGKTKDEQLSVPVQQPQQPQQQQQQQRSSSLHRLFWGGHRGRESSKKGLGTAFAGSVSSVKSCWSSPEGLSRVGVDVTSAAGVDLSDTESSSGGKGSRPSSAHYPLTGHSYTSPSPVSAYVLCGAHSAHNLGANPSSRAKASTLPRSGSDMHANVSFLHKSHRNLTSTNTLPHSYTLVPQPADGTAKPEKPRQSVTVTGAKTVVHVNQESPKFRREVRSWPDENNSPEASTRKATQPAVQSVPRGKSYSPEPAAVKLGVPVPSVTVAECPERNVLKVSGASSHTGSSDPDSMTEEDIDRLVALHTKNRSLSSLGVCSESMSSVYSAAGGGHYGTVTVRGEVQFGLGYSYTSGALEVHIKQCRDLAPVDAKRNRSDPYVKVYLLPDKSKSGKRKTRVRKHTLNPMFNEILKFHVTISELETRTLWLTVWHSDMFGRNEFLGEVTLPMGYEAWDDTSAKWYMLQERLGPPEEVYSYKGDLVVALKFVPPDVTMQKKGRHSRGALHVLVKEARNLMAVCANGTSDPFCKCYLLPDKGKSNKQKTHVVKRTCNPKWNHTFVYDDVTVDELRERCLELTVWDYDRLTSNDFLGGIRLSLGTGKHHGKKVDWIDSQGDEVTVWQLMLDRPNIWVDGTILLRPTMDHRQTAW